LGDISASCGVAEWLAWKPARNHVRNASILLGCTGLYELTHVSENGGAGEVSVCDSRGNDALAVFVPFDIATGFPSE